MTVVDAPPLRTTPAPACRRCGAAGQVRHAALADRILAAPGTWSVRACTRCRLTWLDPQPHPDDIGRLYEGAYMTHAASAADAHVSDRTRRYLASHYGYAGPGGSWLPATRLVDDQLGGRVCWLPARPGGTVLDMGCGSGAFPARMRASDGRWPVWSPIRRLLRPRVTCTASRWPPTSPRSVIGRSRPSRCTT